MKKLIISFLGFFLFATLIHAQSIITETKLLYPSGTSIVKNIENGNSTYTYGSYNIGKELSGAIQKIYRIYFSIDLSTIPTNATIQEVKVNYSTDYKGYTFKLTNISSLGSTLAANWEAINGSALHSAIGYGSGTITSTPVKTQMQSALSSRSMMIGGVGENETANDSYAYLSINLEVRYTRPAASLNFIAQNYMDGGNSGNIGVGINTPTITSRTSPFSFSIYEAQTMYFQAYDNQSYNNYNWVFNDSEAPLNLSIWQMNYFNRITNVGQSSSISRPALTSENGATFQAVLKKITNITFQNNFVGVGNGGVITVNGTQYNSPTSSFQVVEQNAITAEAYGLPLTNGIEYSFSRWNDGNTSSTRTFYPNANATYTASFIGKPTNSGENVSAGANVGQPIVVYWTDNPNTAVNQFQIWRKVKQTGDIPTLIATVGRGVQTYTDYEYVATNGYTNDLLHYDVRAYYSTEGTYSDPSWVAAFGRLEADIVKDDNLSAEKIGSLEIPTEYSISNYPNPFNPTTTINYQLPENGFVTLKVYDMLGREVATLVNENKSAGYYKVNFDASKLTSGVYIYTIRANNYVQSKKMLLMK